MRRVDAAMLPFAPPARRVVVASALALSLLLVWNLPRPLPWERAALPRPPPRAAPHVAAYLGQAYAHAEPVSSSSSSPPSYPYAGLRAVCAHVEGAAHGGGGGGGWGPDAAYLDCVGMLAGITSIVSQVKVCLKMAADSGSHLVLPRMPLRSSDDLRAFNWLNDDAYMAYNEWFDADHLRAVMATACPRMRIVHPDDLYDADGGGGGDGPARDENNGKSEGGEGAAVAVRHRWSISVTDAPGYVKVQSYFWVGRPFAAWFEEQYRRLRYLSNLDSGSKQDASSSSPENDGGGGINVVKIDSEFLLFRITDDATGRELAQWNDLGHAVRFRADVRRPARRLLERLLAGPAARPWYGVHFRVENDTIWSSLEDQLARDLDALDRAWDRLGDADTKAAAAAGVTRKPLVYLACGDPVQVEKFVAAGAARGWEVTHKWKLAALDAPTSSSSGGGGGSRSSAKGGGGDDYDDPAVSTQELIDTLAFDFQGAVDMAVMVRAQFFVGITGSAFSTTVAHLRDPTGRYRGSSFDVWDDGGAGNHLFFEGDTQYACCL